MPRMDFFHDFFFVMEHYLSDLQTIFEKIFAWILRHFQYWRIHALQKVSNSVL